MHPEESSVPSVGHLLTASLACVLPQELANHCLCNGLDHARIRIGDVEALSISSAPADVESMVELGSKGRNRRTTCGRW
jgi:hypothetical protein